MRRKAILFCAALLAGLAAGRAVAQSPDTLKALLAFQQCPLSSYLKAVYERPAAVEGDAAFLKVSVTDRPLNYVQCKFTDDRKKLYCEASSYVDGGPGAFSLSLPAEALAALAKIGFATGDAKQNFPYERALRDTPDFDAIATMMLTALHDAYGVRAETELETYAPFAGNLITVCRLGP